MAGSRRTSIGVAVVMVLCLARAQAHAQQAGDTSPEMSVYGARQIIPFLEPTDAFVAPGEGTYFEANIFPHLVAWQNFIDFLRVEPTFQGRSDAIGRLQLTKPKRRLYWSVSGTPAVKLRMYRQASNPVRTPSYMPKATVQVIVPFGADEALGRLDRIRQIRVQERRALLPAETRRAAAPRVVLLAFHGVIGHHSNGQDGCFYQGQQRVGNTDECAPSVVPATAEDAQRLVNKHDGSFSTNYVKAGFDYRLNWLSTQDGVTRLELTAGAELEHHPKRLMDSHEIPFYGRTRTSLSFEAATRGAPICPVRLQVRELLTIIAGAPSTVWPVITTTDVVCFPTPSGGWGLYARYYGGQDDYNMAFLDNRNRFEIGFTFSQDGFFRFLLSNSTAAASLVGR